MAGNPAAIDNSDGRRTVMVRGTEIRPYNLTHGANIPLEGRYSRITGTLAATAGFSGHVRIFGDDILLGDFRYEANDYPLEISLGIVGVNTLRIVPGVGMFYNIELDRFD